MKFSTYLIILLVGATAVCSCTDDVAVHQYTATKVDGWAQADTLTFDVPEVKSSGDYEVSLGLRAMQTYPYSNLWLIVEQSYTEPDLERCDTLQLEMSDAEGNLEGKGVTFEEFEAIVDTVHLEEHQKGQIRVRHFMNQPVVCGIHDLGVRVAKGSARSLQIFNGKVSFFE